MSKKLKFLAIGFLALALVVGGANVANATLTLADLTITSSGALTLSGAAASAISVGNTAQTAAISIGDTAASIVSEISIGGGDGVKTAINIGDGAGANGITIGGAASLLTIGATVQGASPLVFEGLTANAFELTLAIPDVGADATITLPSSTSTLATLAGTETLTNKTLTSPVLTTPALGTPASGVLTNATGLPAASVLAGSFGAGAFVISTSLQSATYELGHATDTTLSRVSAGLIAVEGVNVVDVSTAQTLSNKTLTAPVIGAATGTSLSVTGTITPTSGATGAAPLTNILKQTFVIDFGAFAGGGASQNSAQVMTGVGFGDACSVGVDADTSAEYATAGVTVTSAGNIVVVVTPLTAAGTVNPASHTYTVTCLR